MELIYTNTDERDGCYVTRSRLIDKLVMREICNQGEKRIFLNDADKSEFALCNIGLDDCYEVQRRGLINKDIVYEGFKPDYTDVAIMTAFYVIFKNGNVGDGVYCSTKDIIRMVRKDSKYNPSGNEIKEFNRRIFIMWNASLECSVYKDTNHTFFAEKGHFLDLRHDVVSDDRLSNKVEMWKILAAPLLIEYCERAGFKSYLAADFFEGELIDTRYSSDVIAFQERIALRIHQYAYGFFNNRSIAFERVDQYGNDKGLMAFCGLYRDNFSDRTSWSRKKKAFKQATTAILGGFIESGVLPFYVLKGDGFEAKVTANEKIPNDILKRADSIILPSREELFNMPFWANDKARKNQNKKSTDVTTRPGVRVKKSVKAA